MGVPGFFVPDLVRNPSPLSDFRALQNIKKIIREGKFDLVHTHTSKAGVIGRMAAHTCGVPAVHTPHGHVFYGYFGALLTRVFVYAERMMARNTGKIISLTDIETRESLENRIGSPGQYITIHSGVPLSPFREIPAAAGVKFRREFDIPADTFLFISIGRLVPIKGFDILIKAMAEAKFNCPTWLAITGDGEERNNLEKAAALCGIAERIRFTGALADIRPALSAANMFVLASRNEGMGRVFIEAMAASLPVIGTAVGGVPSLITEGKTGMLVPGENPAALARAMEKATVATEAMKELGTNAAAMVYPEYDETTMIDRLAALYREVLEKQ